MASSGISPVLVNEYSKAPAGRLELSASAGIKGLHPFIMTSMGLSSSSSSIPANGNLAWNVAFMNLGRPYVAPEEPFPEPGCPKRFQSGTFPSRIFVPLSSPFTDNAANMQGSLKTSGRFLTDICDIAPVPSRQNIPAPSPPIGNAILFRYSPE